MISASGSVDDLINRYQVVMGDSLPMVIFRDPLLARSWAQRIAL